MTIPTLVLCALALSTSLVRYAPAYSVGRSYLWTTVVVYLLELLAWGTWKVVLYPNYFSPLRDLPSPPNDSFFMGQFPRILKEASGDPMRDWVDSVPNDGLIRYKVAFNTERIMPTSPKALAEVLVHKNYEFIKPPQFRHGLGKLLGIGILLAEGDEHKRQRKNLMPAFAFRHVKDLYPVFWSKAREVTEAMTAAIQRPDEPNGNADASNEKPGALDSKPTNVVEIGNWASRVTLDIIGVAGMGQDFHAIANPKSELITTYGKIFTPSKVARIMQILGIFIPIPLLRLIPIKRNQEIEEASQTIKRICRELIQQKRQRMETEKGERTDTDILAVALESGGFSDEDLVNQLMTFLAAGHETTASALTWAVYLLCKHPSAQAKLREEIRASLPSISAASGTVSASQVDALPYLNAVCNETLRVIPSVPLSMRMAAHDTSILSHPIPKDTMIILSPWAINHSTHLWGPDAHDFKPERWIGPGRANTGGASSNYAFMTFLHGPRSCIGQSFAKAEFACLLAAWVGRFEMEFEDPGFELVIQGGITARPKGGLRVRLKAVEGW